MIAPKASMLDALLRAPAGLRLEPTMAGGDVAWLTIRFLMAIGPATRVKMPAWQALSDRASPA
jgi:hypothetical protein